MFKKIVVVAAVLFMTGTGYSAGNTTGWNDTARITAICTTGVVAYTRVYPLSDFEDMRIVVKVNDSTAAGFASDSVSFSFGYQTGIEVLNSLGKRDTCWDDLITVDTVNKSDFGTRGSGVSASDGSVTRTWGGADTLLVTGFATMSRWVIPEWDGLVRLWVRGLAANKKGAPLVLFLEPRRRVEARTR
jgi:hypothetical protein